MTKGSKQWGKRKKKKTKIFNQPPNITFSEFIYLYVFILTRKLFPSKK